MKIKSPIGFLALWSAFLAAGTWSLPARALVPEVASAATTAVVGSVESPKLIHLDDVLVPNDGGLPGGPDQQVCLRLGIPVATDQDAGFVAEGSLSRGLEFVVMSGESDSGFRVQLQLDSRLVLQTVHTMTSESRNVTVRTMLFSGLASHADKNMGILGLAISTSVSATASEAARSATIVFPLGETYHAGLASAFVRQTEALMRESDATGATNDDQDSDGGGIHCTPACQCECGAGYDACKRIAIGAFWVCLGLTVTAAHAILLGTCLIGCAAASVAFLPCFYGCAKIVAAGAFTKIKDCFIGAGVALTLCELGLSDCLNRCIP
jgi:hypothetical protein